MHRSFDPVPRSSFSTKLLKAQITHASLVLAAAALLREEGPQAISYRRVAKEAGAASSAVGYYFDSLDELLREAEEYNIQLWVRRSEQIAEAAEKMPRARCRRLCPKLLVAMCLPVRGSEPTARYLQLISVGDASSITEEYRLGYREIAESVERVLSHVGIVLDAQIVFAVVDGAAVGALSEGLDMRAFAEQMVRDVVDTADPPSSPDREEG